MLSYDFWFSSTFKNFLSPPFTSRCLYVSTCLKHSKASLTKGQCSSNPRSHFGGDCFWSWRGRGTTTETRAQGLSHPSPRSRDPSPTTRGVQSTRGVYGSGATGLRGSNPSTQDRDLWVKPRAWWKESTFWRYQARRQVVWLIQLMAEGLS